jgi:beta-phosphoglucomutase
VLYSLTSLEEPYPLRTRTLTNTNNFGVIFDMDGVLVDSYTAHRESWQHIARQQGVTMTDADFARTFGRTTRELIHQLWPGRFDDAATAALDTVKEAAYRDL